MRTNQAGLDLIKGFEGFRAKPYICAGGVLTIGYGHTKTAKDLHEITEAEGEALLRKDIVGAEESVKRHIKVRLTENQFSALVSLVFNCGNAPLVGTLGRALNEGNYKWAADEFTRWNKAAGKVLPGLVRRRQAERELFLKD